MFDPKTKQWTTLGSGLAKTIEPDMDFSAPPADTSLLDAFKNGGNAVPPSAGGPIPGGPNAAQPGGLFNAVKQFTQDRAMRERVNDVTGGGFHPMDLLAGTPDRSVATLTPEAKQQLLQYLQSQHGQHNFYSADQNNPAVQQVIQQLIGGGQK